VPLKDLLAVLQNQRTLFLGDAALKYRDMILGGSPLFSVAHSGIALQRAASVGYCASDMYKAGAQQTAYSLEPFYLRETQAERVYAEKRDNGA
jgi:tRNA A37 threonylcarbamoyladenosine modification protein TsaB